MPTIITGFTHMDVAEAIAEHMLDENRPKDEFISIGVSPMTEDIRVDASLEDDGLIAIHVKDAEVPLTEVNAAGVARHGIGPNSPAELRNEFVKTLADYIEECGGPRAIEIVRISQDPAQCTERQWVDEHPEHDAPELHPTPAGPKP